MFGFNRHLFRTYAEYVCWPEDGLLATRPADLTDEEAASIPYGGLLALHHLRRANVQAGQRVLVYGASGAVGTSAVQLVTHFGAEVTGGVQHGEPGAGAVSRRDEGGRQHERGLHRSGRTLRPHLGPVGRKKSAAGLRQGDRALAPGGKRLSVDDGTPKLLAEDLMLLGELAGRGEIRPMIDRCHPWQELIEAYRYIAEGHERGNVIIVVAQGDQRLPSNEMDDFKTDDNWHRPRSSLQDVAPAVFAQRWREDHQPARPSRAGGPGSAVGPR